MVQVVLVTLVLVDLQILVQEEVQVDLQILAQEVPVDSVIHFHS